MRNSLSESNRYEAFHSNGLIPVMLPRNARLKLKLGSKGYSNLKTNSFGGLLDKNSPLEMKSCHPISFQYRKDPMGIKLME